MPLPLHLAVALDGTGWHPASWREPDARPGDLFTAGYWLDLVTEAERGLLDLVTLEDSFALQSTLPTGADGPGEQRIGQELDRRIDQVRGRLDTVLVAARVAPLTTAIGLVPSVVATLTEPFHVSKAIATLDHVSTGRAGVRVRVSARADEAAHVGRRPAADLTRPDEVADLFEEAADHVEVLRRLWDSWEDDAEIRDAATGRFVDVDKLHRVDFTGRHFSVRGPSIIPRPPQGQPVVTALAHSAVPLRFAARSADVVHVTPRDAGHAASLVADVRREQAAAGRGGETVHVFADLAVLIDGTDAAATDRAGRLDDRLGSGGAPFDGDDARLFTGTPAALADLLLDWQHAGITGFRLRPAALPHDLHQITRALGPELQRRGAFRAAYQAGTLRGLLGLPRPANRYAVA